MTKIFCHISDATACSYYRTILPVMQCYSELSRENIQLACSDNLVEGEDCDAYIFSRVIKPDLWQVLHRLQSGGSKIVWQLDDDIWNVPSSNPASHKIHEMDKKRASEMVDFWDAIITSTPELSKLVKKSTFVAPNLIDLSCFNEKKRKAKSTKFSFSYHKPVRVLWAGSNSHDCDLHELSNTVRELIEEFDSLVQFLFWGYFPTDLSDMVRNPGSDSAYLKPKKNLERSLIYLPFSPLRSFFDNLLGVAPDIALGPLVDCKFNHSKSSIKSLEMIMAGAAFVGTDLPPYQWIESGKTGILLKPGDTKGWTEAIRDLIKDKPKRNLLVKNGQEEIRAKYSWQSSARDIWLDMFRKL